MSDASSSPMPLWKKLLIGLLLLVLLLLVTGLIGVRSIGAWKLLFPSHEHETIAPQLPTDLASPALLIFTKTNSFRHIEGIEAGTALLEEIAKSKNWDTVHTENSAVFNPQDLSRFDVVVFLNASGDTLSEQQQLAFQEWLAAGAVG